MKREEEKKEDCLTRAFYSSVNALVESEMLFFFIIKNWENDGMRRLSLSFSYDVVTCRLHDTWPKIALEKKETFFLFVL